MGKIPVENIQDGMVLNTVINDRFGRVLFNIGMTLEKRHIDTFISYGVAEVDVSGEAFTPEEEYTIDPKILEETAKNLEPTFLLANREWEIVDAILRLAVVSVAQRQSEKQ